MQHLCARCRYAVTEDNDGALVFCSHCGAPQVWLSEGLADQAAAERAGLEASNAGAEAFGEPGTVTSEAGLVDWRGAIRCAGLAGLIAMGLALLGLGVPAVTLLALFWAMGASVVMMGIYASRYPQTKISPGFGARLGVLCGLAVGLGSTVVNSGALLVERFLLHRPPESDAALNTQFAQLQASLAQQGGVPGWSAWMNYPETRAGMFLAGMGMAGALYLLFSAAGGAFAGLLRARKSSAA